MRLQGKSIIVTGSTGIAAASAARFIAEGARVFLISINEEESKSLAESLDGNVGWAKADLTDEIATEQAVSEAVAFMEGLNGLMAVVGGSGRAVGDGPLDEIPKAGWDDTISLNLTSTFLSAREATRSMLGGGSGGSIVIVTSVLASSPSPDLFGTHAYAAAKGGQVSLMTAMAARYAPKRIRVNAIAPGLVRTPMSERAYNDPATFRYAASKQPLVSGFLEAEDVAQAATYFLSDESRYVTGQVLAVDGGWSVSEATP